MTKYLKFIFYTSLIFLIIVSIYPGNLIGYLIFDDPGLEVGIGENSFGTSLNHFIYYFYISLLGLFLYIRNTDFKRLLYVLIFISITLEFLHKVIPNRTFQLSDLFANILGVLVAYFIIKIYLIRKRL
tara:strand:+ start:739 stop:1122 length:384 start_codon:yes stop_codon:yes gene_type:complete